MTRPFERATLFVALASIAILGGAFGFQYIGGLKPCELCLAQRWPYVITISAGLIGFGAARVTMRNTARAMLAIAGLTFLVGAGIAVYHVGVEQKWWAGPATCTGLSGVGGSVQDFLKRIENTPVVRCDEIAWSLFGISMAGYNAILSVLLAIFCAVSLKGRK